VHSLSVELMRFWSHCKDFVICHMPTYQSIDIVSFWIVVDEVG